MEIARSALERGQYVKAKRFAEKSMKLFPNDEVMSAHCRAVI